MIGYLDPRGVVTAFQADYPSSNRWCGWAVGTYALCFRLLPLAAVGVSLVALTGSQGGLALGFPSFVLFLLGTALGIVGGALGGGPDFWPQVVLLLSLRYAMRPRPRRANADDEP